MMDNASSNDTMMVGLEERFAGEGVAWLKVFRSATTEMSRTKQSMLSTTHAVFRGLQDHLRLIIKTLPDSTPPRLKRGLLEAHRKLSDYYYKSDESPYYTWAASTFCDLTCRSHSNQIVIVLDPRIGYEGLMRDFADDQDLLDGLHSSVARMRTFFDLHYPSRNTTPTVPVATTAPAATSSRRASPQKPNFTQRYRQSKRPIVDELDTFFKLQQEDFDSTNPIACGLPVAFSFLAFTGLRGMFSPFLVHFPWIFLLHSH
jgi:hypothetical protein